MPKARHVGMSRVSREADASVSAGVSRVRDVTTDLTIHEYGDPSAPTILLVHGVTEAGTSWPDLVARWQDRWHLLAVDLRGHGSSPRFTPDEISRSPEVLVADVIAVLEAQPQPVIVVGHSLGGFLTLRAALARPDLVRAIVLEDPAKPSGAAPDPAFVAMNEGFLDAMADPDAEIARMRRETPWSMEEIEAWAACKGDVDRAYIHDGLFLGDHDWEEQFRSLAVPGLLVLPPEAPMAPDLTQVDNPQLRTVVIPGTGHCVRRDQPEAFHAAVDAFLDGVR